jgi:uncharacterized protein with HEPN domain
LSQSESDYLRHILQEVEYLSEAASAVSREAFLENETLRRAFARSLEFIGEAAGPGPAGWRAAHADIDWRAMAGMRNRLIHGYFGVDYDIVWEVASTRLPALRPIIARLLAGARKDEDRA